MQDNDVEAAVAAALSLDWEKARKINSKILSECPTDIDCLNRLGRAFMELGEYKKACNCFKKVLKISRYDPIALKNLERVTSLSAKTRKTDDNAEQKIQSTKLISFLDEPGKTRLVTLVNVAPAKILLSQNHADPVSLIPRRHTILVQDCDQNYLGALPDDLSHRIFILMKGGNKYDAFVKSVGKNMITIFIREADRAKRFRNTPSFPTSGADYLSFVREEALPEENREITTEGEDDEEESSQPKTPRSFDDNSEEN